MLELEDLLNETYLITLEQPTSGIQTINFISQDNQHEATLSYTEDQLSILKYNASQILKLGK